MIERFVRDAAGKDEAVVKQLANYEHFSGLLEEGRKAFSDLEHCWGHQSKEAMLAKQVVALTSEVKDLKKMKQNLQVNAQNNANKDKDKQQQARKCFNCGEVGQIAKDCPKPKKQCNGNSNGNGNTNGTKGLPPEVLKWAAPKDGEPMKNNYGGKTYHWCSKCKQGKGQWQDSHPEEQHVVGFAKQQKKAMPVGQIHESPTEVITINQDVGVLGCWFDLE